jgi:hypothetical protein
VYLLPCLPERALDQRAAALVIPLLSLMRPAIPSQLIDPLFNLISEIQEEYGMVPPASWFQIYFPFFLKK